MEFKFKFPKIELPFKMDSPQKEQENDLEQNDQQDSQMYERIMYLIKDLKDMGLEDQYDDAHMREAIKQCPDDTAKAIEILMSGEVAEIIKNGGIRKSTQAKRIWTKEPIGIGERMRDTDVPSGLKNIGNTCYFASLI